MQVIANAQCASDNFFQLGGDGGGQSTSVSREVDLSGAATATLTFIYRRSAGANGGTFKVKVSNDGRPPWTTLQIYNMNGSKASQVPQSFDLTAYVASTTHVRFVRSGNVNRLFYADNVDIAWN